MAIVIRPAGRLTSPLYDRPAV